MLDSISMPPVLLLLAKATLLLGAAFLVHATLRQRFSAAQRHLMWAATLVSLLLLPVVAAIVPSWSLWSAASPSAAQEWRTATPDLADMRAADDAGSASSASATVASTERDTRPQVTEADDQNQLALTLPQLLMAAYSVGVLIMLARLAREYTAVRRLELFATNETDAAWTQLLDELRRTVGLIQPVRLLRSGDVVSPMTWGIRRPTLILPVHAETWAPERRRAVLLHELAHIVRWDCLTQLLAAMSEVMYWFHPGVRLAAKRLRVERELACDDAVLRAGMTPRDYATELLDIARGARAGRVGDLALAFHEPSMLEGRLRAILDGARPRSAPRRRTVFASLTLMAALLNVVAAAQPARRNGPPQFMERLPIGRSSAELQVTEDRRIGEAGAELQVTEDPRIGEADAELQVTEDLRIGGASPELQFTEVDRIVVGNDGAMFVSDSGGTRLRLYDRNGRFVRQVGARGNAPGQFREVIGMVVTPSGELAVYDVFSKRISFYDSKGTFVRSIPSRVGGNWTGNDFHVDREGNLYVFGIRYSSEGRTPTAVERAKSQRFYLKLSPTGAILDTVDIPNSTARSGPGFVIITPEGYLEPFADRLVYDLAPTGHLVWGYTKQYEFQIDQDGGRSTPVRRAFTPLPLGAEERAEWQGRADFYTKRLGQRSASSGTIIPAQKPAFRDIQVGDDGRIWVHRYSQATKRPLSRPPVDTLPPPLTWREVQTFDVFEADGRFFGSVMLPENTRVLASRGAQLWGVQINAKKEAFVVRYRME